MRERQEERIGTRLVGPAEPSGVTRLRDDLLIVSDADPGAYYTLPLDVSTGPLISIRPERVTRHPLAAETLAVDLEAIDVLNDGRVVALSERLRSLIDTEGVVVQYDDPLSELGERGLEGLAIRADGDTSVVAVLWEGGYVEPPEVQPQVRLRLESSPFRPVIFVHTVGARERNSKKKVKDDSALVELDVPTPDAEPDGWRFRAPDLVWHRPDKAAPDVWQFIVLLNSQLREERTGKTKFGPRWLQRFDRVGRRVGDHMDLDERARELLGDDRLRNANWEGVGWYDPGKSLVLVHDAPILINGTPVALVVPLPDLWR